MKPSLGTMTVKPVIDGEHKGSPWHSVPYATYAFNAKQSESTIKLKYGDLEILLKDGKFQFVSKGGAIISNIKEILFMNSKIKGITDDITTIPPEEQRYYALNAFPKILKIGKYDFNETFIANFLNDISNKVDKLTFENTISHINDELNTKASIEYVNNELMKKVNVSAFNDEISHINDSLNTKADINHTHTKFNKVAINEISAYVYEEDGTPAIKLPTFPNGLVTNYDIMFWNKETGECLNVIDNLKNHKHYFKRPITTSQYYNSPFTTYFESELVGTMKYKFTRKIEGYGFYGHLLYSDIDVEFKRTDDYIIIEFEEQSSVGNSDRWTYFTICQYFESNDCPIFDLIYPIGSIYTSMNPTNPAQLFGGKWQQIVDRFLYCADSSKQTGGSKKITVENLPAHNHYFSGNTSSAGEHSHTYSTAQRLKGSDGGSGQHLSWWEDRNTSSNGTHTHSIYGNTQNTGSGTDYMPPYITVYAWYRTG